MTPSIAAALFSRAVAPLGLALLLCCRGFDAPRDAPGDAPEDQSRTSRAASVAQRVRDLKTAFPNADVQLDATGARITALQRLRSPVRGSAEEIVRSVLRIPAVAAALGLSPDLQELCAPVSRPDPQLPNYAIVRMRQCVNGARVMGAELVMTVQLKPSPGIEALTSSLVTNLPRTTTPQISAAAASAAAVIAVRARASNSRGTPPSAIEQTHTPELVIFSPPLFQLDGPTRLCWLVHLERTVVLIDASNGSLVHMYADAMQ